jgi:hypothetical protein
MKNIAKSFWHFVTFALLIGTLLYSIDPAAASGNQRKYYLTKPFVNGAHALGACAKGYHMASIYEIADLSDLSYRTDLGIHAGDQGFGPPIIVTGWVRTGNTFPSADDAKGEANCLIWTSDSIGDFGTTLSLSPNNQGLGLGPWVLGDNVCSDELQEHVWCVED